MQVKAMVERPPADQKLPVGDAPVVSFATSATHSVSAVVKLWLLMTDLPPDPRSFTVTGADSATPTGDGSKLPTVEPEAQRPSSWKRRVGWAIAVLTLITVMFGAVLSLVAWTSWNDVGRVELSEVLGQSTSGTNYLIVGTDSREGINADQPNAGAIIGETVTGERTDSIAVLHIGDDGSSRLLAIPRDLYLNLHGGSKNRVNAAFYFGGPEALVHTIQDELGIGIDHYLQIDLAGFLDLVDALGGVTIDIPNPAYDLGSGLNISTSGPTQLDGDTALAYVRARHYVELIDGVEVRDPTSDLGRVQRQQKFLAAVFDRIGSTYNPFTVLGVVRGVASNVVVDDSMSFRNAARLGLTLRGLDPQTDTLPTRPFTTASGAQVLLLNEAEAEVILAEFR